ncbi:MAG TPA: efflux transporter outer membrane subunit [Bryobacteraceae bacterium]|nr:efflux transporter outer membrane subunit [Bryobacteraceae bacterium]
MRRSHLLVLISIFCSSCAITTRYSRPAVQSPQAFGELAGSDQWKSATPSDQNLRGNWWEIFGDPQLNSFEEKIATSNWNVKQLEALFRVAIETVDINRTGYYPTVTASPGVTQSDRGRNSGAGGATASFTLPFAASWVPDLWNRIGLSVQSANLNAQVSAADLQNLRLSLQGTLAQDYFSLLGTDSQLAILNQNISIYQDYLTLTNNRFTAGVASRTDVLLAQTQLYQTQAQAIDLGVTRHQLEHAIAVLTGVSPAGFHIASGKLPAEPPQVPVGVPSTLLERRPDVAAEERLVMAANVQIGIAKTAFFPTLTLTGQAGLTSGSLLNLLTWGSRVWSAGPTLAETLFDAGRRRATVRQSQDAYDAAAAAYQNTVLNAMADVEDNLATLRVLAEEQAKQQEAVVAGDQSLTLETERYRAGTDSALNVITTQTIDLSNQRTAVTLLQRRLVSCVDLIVALGGGWDASALPTDDQMKSPDMKDPAKTVNVAEPPASK